MEWKQYCEPFIPLNVGKEALTLEAKSFSTTCSLPVDLSIAKD